MKSVKPITLKKASFLSNEEMKHLFGGSAATMECVFTCSDDEKLIASGCASCSATENGGYCIYPTGSAAILLCSSGNGDSGTSGLDGTDNNGFIYV